MNNPNRILFAFMIASILTICVANAEVINSGTCGDTCTWELDNNGQLTITGEGAISDSSGWYSDSDDIVSININAGVTEIGYEVFQYLDNLSSITMPDTLTTIREYAFYGDSQLENIVIPGSVETIEQNAFQNSGITSVVLSEGITTIGYEAFEYCEKLESVSLPETLTSISEYAFYGDSKLESIIIPGSVTTIEENAFQNSGIKNITLNDGFTTIGYEAFEYCESLESIDLPETLTTICEYAFYGDSNLESITIPGSVTTIEQNAFQGTGVQKIVINEGFTSIDYEAFEYCDNLTFVSLPDTLTSIGEYAFYGDGSLEAIFIPSGISSIDSSAFQSTGLNCIYFGGTEAEWNSIIGEDDYFSDIKIVFDSQRPTSEDNNTLLTAGTESPEDTNSNNETNVNVEEVWKCSACGNDATGNFCNNCGERRPEIGADSSVAPASLTEHEEDVREVYTEDDFSYSLLDNANAEIIKYNGNDTKITIPSELDGHSVTQIGQAAFENCTSVETITIWADLTAISNSAFKGCINLKKISIPAATTELGANAFENCTALQSITIWGDLTCINPSTFCNCTSLKKISIPSSAKYIDDMAFYNCSSLASVTIWGDISHIGVSAFEGCTSLHKISVPSSTTDVYESAFKGCMSLSSVTLWGDTNIGNYAFQNCTSLKKISISSGTGFIGEYAFEGCTSLTTVTLWGNDTSVGIGAFDNCPNLKRKPEYPAGNIEASSQNQATPSPTIEAIQTTAPTNEPNTELESNDKAQNDDVAESITNRQEKQVTLSYTEMIELKRNVEAAIVSSLMNQQTECPQGQYVVGEDIPAGSYEITAKSSYSSPKAIIDVMDSDTNIVSSDEITPGKSCCVTVEAGDIISIKYDSSYELKTYIQYS